MRISGQRRIGASREAVWALLDDPAVLARCIPGCERVERLGADGFAVSVSAGAGLVRARFRGTLRMLDKAYPESLRLAGQGDGMAGALRGAAVVRLAAVGAESTVVSFEGESEAGGLLARLGERLIDARAVRLVERFLERLAAIAAR